jgi:hypothetical protein
MGAWSDSEHLVTLLDRQFTALRKATGSSRIVRRRRLLEFLRREPDIFGPLQDFKIEAENTLRLVNEELISIRSRISQIWESHKSWLQLKLRNVKDDALYLFGQLEEGQPASYSNRFQCPIAITEFGQDDDKIAMNCVLGLRHFAEWKKSKEDEGILPEILLLQRRAARAQRELALLRRSAPWIAFRRLERECLEFNAEVVSDGTWADVMSLQNEEKAATLIDSEKVETVYVGQIHDVVDLNEELLQEALALQIGLLRSRYSLISRFAVRCEAFDAERLREIADTKAAGKKVGKPEALLTLRLARYLFDNGIRPLMDPTIGGLRPDIFDTTSGPALYVEAKQYRNKHPSAGIIKNYSQVWSTWARIRKNYNCDEAFLVIFRRAGPLLALPRVVRHEDLKLYAIVVDISAQGGSKEKDKVISLSEAELRPQTSGQQVVTPKAARSAKRTKRTA